MFATSKLIAASVVPVAFVAGWLANDDGRAVFEDRANHSNSPIRPDRTA